jgi:hypothetical protein
MWSAIKDGMVGMAQLCLPYWLASDLLMIFVVRAPPTHAGLVSHCDGSRLTLVLSMGPAQPDATGSHNAHARLGTI